MQLGSVSDPSRSPIKTMPSLVDIPEDVRSNDNVVNFTSWLASLPISLPTALELTSLWRQQNGRNLTREQWQTIRNLFPPN